MTSEFSNRLMEAKKLVKKRSVKEYIIDKKAKRWLVVGNTREYLVMIDPLWCSCYDFQNCVLNNRIPNCKHNIAVQYAQQENLYDTFHISKEEYNFIRSEFLFL